MAISQSTSATILVGPILDADGLPYITATIASTAFKKVVNGTAGAALNCATGAVADGAQGHYLLAIDAADTATTGTLDIRLELAGYAMQPRACEVAIPLAQAIADEITRSTY